MGGGRPVFQVQTYICCSYAALEPVGRSKSHPKHSVLMELLDEVDRAYGKHATAFRNNILKAWAATAKRQWPTSGTELRKAMDGNFHRLCAELYATRQRTGAEHWFEKPLQDQLNILLVRYVVS